MTFALPDVPCREVPPVPRRPRPPCSVPGCPELTPRGGRCEAHRREAEQQRGTSNERGYTTRWQRIRKAYLYRNPWCLLCGRTAPWSLTTSLCLGVSWWRKGSPSRTRSTICVRCARSVTTGRPRNGNRAVGLPQMRSQFGHRAQPDQGVLPFPRLPDGQGGKKLAWLIRPFRWRRLARQSTRRKPKPQIQAA